LSPPPLLLALEPIIQAFELQNGASLSLQSFSITATGGFHGYMRVTYQQGDTLVFVRDGSSPSENAEVTVQRIAGARRVGPMNKIGWVGPWSPLSPLAQKWSANGIDFYYYTFEGQDENANRRQTFVHASIGKDYVTFTLQCPTSMCLRHLLASPSSSHRCVPPRSLARRTAPADTGWLMVSDRGFPSKSAMPAAYFADPSRIRCPPVRRWRGLPDSP
jgi:hypothetical protein